MIRVCYIVDAPFLGGAERYVSRIALGLDARSFRAGVVLRTPDDEDGGLGEWAAALEAEGIEVARVAMNLPFRPWHARGVVRAIASQSPSLVHVNMPGPYNGQMGLLAPLARMAGARAVVTTEHLPMVERLWKRALVKRFAYRYVDAVLTVSRANVPFLTGAQGVAPGKIVVVPNGLRDDYGTHARGRDETRSGWGIDEDRVVVLFLGNLLHHKGLHRVIRALSELRDLPWHLVVVGTGPEEEACRGQLAEAGVTARATFLGAVPPDEVESIVGAADILSLPSTIEGMPYVVIEAMASGVPVVASDVYGIPELIEHGTHGLLVPPGDGDALRDALAGLVVDGAARARMGAAARTRFLDEFTLSRQVASVESVYRRVLGGSG